MVEYIIVTGRGRNALTKYVESSMQLKAGLEYQNFLFMKYVGLIWDMRHNLLKSVTLFDTFLNDI